MRMSFVLTGATALLLPLALHAEPWPEGKKDTYVKQCVQAVVGQGVDAKMANTHCKCSADAIEKTFSTQEIEQLDSQKPGSVDPELAKRAQEALAKACASAN